MDMNSFVGSFPRTSKCSEQIVRVGTEWITHEKIKDTYEVGFMPTRKVLMPMNTHVLPISGSES